MKLSLYESNVNNLTINNSKLWEFQAEDSEISGRSMIINCVINGLNLASSKATDFIIKNSTIAEYLITQNAQFENMNLININYKRPLDIVDEGVSYTNSNTFPSK